MPDTSYGLLSGKYDSTKQRAVLLNGDRLRNYQSYTATMRMELLLTGQLVLTDAQFFDGLYFHWLGKDKDELEALKKLMCPFQHSLKSENSLFSVSVKCRPPKEDKSDPECKGNPDSDYVATKMFCKQFQFSSMEDDDLMRAVFDLSSDYDECHWANYGDKEQEKVHSLEQDLSAYISNMQEQLEQVYGPKSSIAMNWKQYTEELTNLFCIPMNKWGFCDGSGRWIVYNFLDGMDQCLNQLFDDNETTITYREKMEKLLETACGPDGMCENPAAKRYFARCRSELNINIKNRSKITVALDELERLCGHIKREREHLNAQMNKAEECLKEFRQLMNDRYNKMLAFQHGCQFLDLCDYPNVFKQIDKRNIQIHFINKPELVKTLVKTLAELSWADFVTQLGMHQRELEDGFHEWMSAYKEFSEDKMENLIKALTQYLEKLTTTLKSSCTDKTELKVEPWNRDGTCNSGMRNIFAKSYLSPYYLVNGGSFEASSKGNEICLLCVEQSNDNMAIIRLRIDSSESKDDNSLDTLIAPVFNPLNGGALQHVKEEYIVDDSTF